MEQLNMNFLLNRQNLEETFRNAIDHFEKNKKNQAYPPELSACPDYWKVLADGSCQNVNSLGNGAPNIVDFDKDYKTAVERCNFGKQYGIEWDGLTNASPKLC